MHRRSVMLGAAAALAAPVLFRAPAALAQAASPVPPPATPGFFRFRLGGATVTTLFDGYFQRPLAGLIRNASQEATERAAREAFLGTDPLRIPYSVTMLQSGPHTVLFDAGTGGQLAPTGGWAMANMRAAGVTPEQVTLVVHSHFHPDHISGLTTRDNAVVFPNAEVAVPEAEWRFWTDAGAASRAPQGMRPLFAAVERRFGPYRAKLRQFGADAEIVPGVRAIAAHGHTPGHTVFEVTDGDAGLLVLSDTTNRPELFARNPGWHAVFDMDPQMAEANRRRLLDRAANDRLWVTGYHFPFPIAGHIARQGDGFRYVAADWINGV
ncbi:MAG TPA: MBL fold metallo-hydrolase [Falsiroseomonas sp.]|nr:MBL fold metallo-hydrolase [Falsiroseomonas sp.]